MKIEVGKKYRMRNGGVAEIVLDDGTGYLQFCVRGGRWYGADGKDFSLVESPYDLISPLEDHDGWIPHTPGDPCPVDGDVVVETKLCLGLSYYAKWIDWDNPDITAYRIHKPEERKMSDLPSESKAEDGDIVIPMADIPRITLPAKPYIDPEINAIISVLMLPDEQRKRVVEYLRGRCG